MKEHVPKVTSLSTTIGVTEIYYSKNLTKKTKKELTLSGIADKMIKFKPDDLRALGLNKLIVEMICLD